MSTILGRFGRALGLTIGGVGRTPMLSSVARAFAPLDAALPGLAERISDHVATGGSASVLSTIASTPAITRQWRQRGIYYPRRDENGLFAPGTTWDAAQMRRFGEVSAALEPITCEYGFFGTKKSPPWLGEGRKDRPVAQLAALCDEADGGGTFGVCDILFCRDAARYGSTDSIDRFADVAA